jgi:hypothetical protein
MTMIPEQVNMTYDQLMAGVAAALPGGSPESFDKPDMGRAGDAPVGQQVFNHKPGSLKAALAGGRARYPSIWVSDIMGAAVPKYTSVKLKPMGACLDMLCLGACKEIGCTYKHPTMGISIDPARAAMVAAILKAGYAAYAGVADTPNKLIASNDMNQLAKQLVSTKCAGIEEKFSIVRLVVNGAETPLIDVYSWLFCCWLLACVGLSIGCNTTIFFVSFSMCKMSCHRVDSMVLRQMC